MKTSTTYSPEVRERAVRMVREHQGEHESEWAAIISISGLQRWGYQVFVPADAILSRSAFYKENVLERMRQGGIQVVCTESVGFEWIGDSSDEQFREVWSLFKSEKS